MPKNRVAMIAIVAAALFIGVLIAAGCGGGGPLKSQNTNVTAAAQFTQLLPAAQKSATRVGDAQCGKCHAADHTTWMATKHAAALVDCEACHGPGSAHAAAPSLTNILRGIDSTNPIVCGQCHSDILNDWSGSKHAQIVADPVNTGSNNCLRCHSGAFRALNVDSPISHGQTPAQVDTAIVALSNATLQSFIPATHETANCANCHDPHQNTTNLTSAGEQFYLRRATSSTDLSSDLPNAPVAQYTTVNHICGSCHNNRGGDPSDAGLTKNTSRPATHEGPEYNMLNGYGGAEDAAGPPTRTSTHVTAPDQCVQCHMPNSRHTFTVSLDISCAPCHTAPDAAARETTVQSEVQNGLVALRTRMQNWAQATFKDPAVWDYTTNIPSTSKIPTQSQVPIQIKRARHNYYFILLDRSLGVHNAPYTLYLLNYANTNLDALGISRVAVPLLNRRQAIAILNEDIGKIRAANTGRSDL
jgi:hypothetical protein